MKITVINGTEVKGCTYHIKENFLDVLREGNEITEFYLPKDMPHFCCGCKTCFLKSESMCPHAKYVMPIWEALLDADLLVFTSPVYALRATGQLKALLDHLCVHWMVHRPDDQMFSKCAVVLTNAIGVFNGGAQKDIATSLLWLGISDIKKLGVGLLEGIVWDELSEKRRGIITAKIKKLAKRYVHPLRPARRGLKVSLLFSITRAMHQGFSKKENPLSADNQYWLDKGWIK
ncbi:MAG: flavodoxin family protein [Christensenella sp.]|uniref:flavodoxin family protein n=1 Tax=Christensenella sp. TaxID=1935934 RepID=UPI002B207821|nr:flavodoxin family protein [Christensenella sp.]MEA5002887.1 flavodoxin family protein [Christensenella sp.]